MANGDGASFESDVKPLFREKDQKRMEFAFDLWNYEQVKENADGILERVEEGDMPCDEAWSPEQISTFKGWMDSGMAP